MRKLYLSYCTEIELGWGQRPDGALIGLSIDDVNKYIENEKSSINENKESPYHYDYQKPIEVYCNKPTYDKILNYMRGGGIVNISQSYLKEFKFYKLIN